MAREDHKQYLKKPFRFRCKTLNLSKLHIDTLMKCGAWFEALATEKIKPETPQQEQFMRLVRGEKLPNTMYELAWHAYATECIFYNARYLESQYLQHRTNELRIAMLNEFSHAASLGHSGAKVWLNKNLYIYSDENYIIETRTDLHFVIYDPIYR